MWEIFQNICLSYKHFSPCEMKPNMRLCLCRSCPGAVLFLPLLNLHLSRLCQALDSLRSTSASSSSSHATAASFLPAACPAPAAGSERQEETSVAGFRVEDTGLAALRLLYLLLAHSDEVMPPQKRIVLYFCCNCLPRWSVLFLKCYMNNVGSASPGGGGCVVKWESEQTKREQGTNTHVHTLNFMIH